MRKSTKSGNPWTTLDLSLSNSCLKSCPSNLSNLFSHLKMSSSSYGGFAAKIMAKQGWKEGKKCRGYRFTLSARG